MLVLLVDVVVGGTVVDVELVEVEVELVLVDVDVDVLVEVLVDVLVELLLVVVVVGVGGSLITKPSNTQSINTVVVEVVVPGFKLLVVEVVSVQGTSDIARSSRSHPPLSPE